METLAIYISVDGKEISPNIQVLSIDVMAELNRIPWAELCLLDGDLAKRKFAVSETGTFDPGKKVAISLGYQNQPGTKAKVFEGLVARQSVEADPRGALLRIECRHGAFAMTQARKSATFVNKDDNAVISTLAKGYGDKVKLKMSAVAGPKHANLVQYFASDWDFMLSRCQANGWFVVPKAVGLEVIGTPRVDLSVPKERTLDFNFAQVHSFAFELDGGSQYGSTSAQSWSYEEQKVTSAVEKKLKKQSPGKLDPGAIAGLSDGVKLPLFHGAPLPRPELEAWAKGAILRNRMAFLRGRFEVQGNAKIKVGQSCKIVGIGSRYDGSGYITGVRQRLSPAGWFTDLQLGIPARPYHAEQEMADAPAGGLLPAVNGLQVGLVRKFEKDKGGQHRVQVALPAMGKESNVIWARMAMPTAGKGAAGPRGLLFWPEEGDEVVVGFLNDDPRAAIVLGSLFNSKNAPIFPLDAKNARKGLVTKSGSKLEFDDEKQEIILSTKEKLEMRLQEKEQTLSLKDKSGGAVFKLGKDGISMVFGGSKIQLTKDGVKLEGAGQKIELVNAGVNVKSNSKLTMKASGGALLDGGPKVDIKGGMVELK